MATGGEQHQQVGGARVHFKALFLILSNMTAFCACAAMQEVPADQAYAHGGRGLWSVPASLHQRGLGQLGPWSEFRSV